MAEPPEPDLDEKFSLDMEGEEAVRRLLGVEDEGETDVEEEDS